MSENINTKIKQIRLEELRNRLIIEDIYIADYNIMTKVGILKTGEMFQLSDCDDISVRKLTTFLNKYEKVLSVNQ
jgi:hypothetical protein